MNAVLIYMRTFLIILSLTLSTLVNSTAAQVLAAPGSSSVPKFALLIGNSNYSGNRRSLNNPVNDIKLMAKNLRRLGFDVKQYADLDRNQMMKAIAEFAEGLPAGATSLVFYAGHGMQIGGASYLVPVDMVVTSEQSAALRAYPLKTLLERVATSKSSVNIVVLDACRDNPFQPNNPVRYRNFSNLGLAPVQAPTGTIVAYSTAPGQLAADGREANSIYTSTLADVILEPKLSIEAIFKRVSEQVRKKSLDDQIPWYESSLNQEYFFLPPDGVTVVAGRTFREGEANPGEKSRKRGVEKSTQSSTDELWYRSMTESEWSNLDWEIQQRVKHMTADEIPMMEHKAKGGSVVAQTTLGLFWLAGAAKVTNSGNSSVSRYKSNNTKSLHWLRMAVKSGFPVAQTELGEMHYMGNGVDRNVTESRRLLELAAQASYPRAKLDLLQIALEAGQVRGSDLESVIKSTIRGMSPIGK